MRVVCVLVSAGCIGWASATMAQEIRDTPENVRFALTSFGWPGRWGTNDCNRENENKFYIRSVKGDGYPKTFTIDAKTNEVLPGEGLIVSARISDNDRLITTSVSDTASFHQVTNYESLRDNKKFWVWSGLVTLTALKNIAPGTLQWLPGGLVKGQVFKLGSPHRLLKIAR